MDQLSNDHAVGRFRSLTRKGATMISATPYSSLLMISSGMKGVNSRTAFKKSSSSLPLPPSDRTEYPNHALLTASYCSAKSAPLALVVRSLSFRKSTPADVSRSEGGLGRTLELWVDRCDKVYDQG